MSLVKSKMVKKWPGERICDIMWRLNIVVSGATGNSPDRIHLLRRCIVNTLPPHVPNGNTAYIYGLVDPRTHYITYIGRTTQRLNIRLNQHIDTSQRKRSQCARCKWIRSLLEEGLRPSIVVLDMVSVGQAAESEGEWIAMYRAIGVDLLNEQSHNVGGSKSYIVDWTPDKIERLGTVSDETLAQEWGVDRKTIGYKRKRLGIPPANPLYAAIDYSKKPALPEKAIAMMGKYTDNVIAQQFGVPKSRIKNARQSRGIARPLQSPPFMGGWNRIEWPQSVTERFGALPDYLLAQELGVQKSVIARARKRLGISSYADQHGNSTRFAKGHQPTRRTKEGGDA